jgi:hypothetical protein
MMLGIIKKAFGKLFSAKNTVPIAIEFKVITSEISDEEFAARKTATALKRKEWRALGKEEQLKILSQRAREHSLAVREEQLRLGIKEAIWLYSGVSCAIKNQYGTSSAQDEAHMAANGKRYKISEGMYLNGKSTWPGYEDGCRCVSRSIIKELDKD